MPESEEEQPEGQGQAAQQPKNDESIEVLRLLATTLPPVKPVSGQAEAAAEAAAAAEEEGTFTVELTAAEAAAEAAAEGTSTVELTAAEAAAAEEEGTPPALPDRGTNYLTAYVCNLSRRGQSKEPYESKMKKTYDPSPEEFDEDTKLTSKNKRTIVLDKQESYPKFDLKNEVYKQLFSKATYVKNDPNKSSVVSTDNPSETFYTMEESNQSRKYSCSKQALTKKENNLYKSALERSINMATINLNELSIQQQHFIIGLFNGRVDILREKPDCQKVCAKITVEEADDYAGLQDERILRQTGTAAILKRLGFEVKFVIKKGEQEIMEQSLTNALNDLKLPIAKVESYPQESQRTSRMPATGAERRASP